MPRTARLLLDGGCYHVLTRGNNQATVFHDPADFQHYGQLLLLYLVDHHVRLYHYCFMPNHVHLVVEAPAATGLTKAMHGLNLSYALAYKKRHRHTGHFWQDRFKSLLIAHDSYLLQCGVYVERNPVRAQLVKTPEAYPWSSYRVYAEGCQAPLITPNPLYAMLGVTPTQRQIRYRQLVHEPVRPLAATWLHQRAIGSPTFLHELEQQLEQPILPRPRGRPQQVSHPNSGK